MKYQSLFNHMHSEHGLILLETEMQEMQKHFNKDETRRIEWKWAGIALFIFFLFGAYEVYKHDSKDKTITTEVIIDSSTK